MKSSSRIALRTVLFLILVVVLSIYIHLLSVKPLSRSLKRARISPRAENILFDQFPESWLERLNAYRGAAGLPPVAEDPSSSADLAKHMNYMLLNPDDIWHGESPGRPGYTREGHQAAAESNLWFTGPDINAATAIDVWMGSIHHRYGLLNYDLITTGFAIACNTDHCGAGLNVLRGLQESSPMPNGVIYPGTNQQGVDTDVFISWQFGWYPRVILRTASLKDESGKLIAIKTSSPQPDEYINMVAIIPKENLTAATTYIVDLHVMLGDKDLNRTWAFKTAGFRVYLPIIQRRQ